jgi:membrane-associated phospholipid phosphatase
LRDSSTQGTELSLAAFFLISALSTLTIRPAGWPWLVAAQMFATVIVSVIALRVPFHRAGYFRVARVLAPLLLFPFLYKMTGRISAGLDTWILDGPIEHFEAIVFRGQPSMLLSQRAPWIALSEFLHLCYFSYYLVVPAVAVSLIAQKREREAARAVFAICGCFFLLGIFYIWLPVTSPLYKYPPLAPPLGTGFFYRLNHAISARGGVPGAAFPSSHAALSTLSLLLARRWDRRLFRVLLFPVLGILFATVYCRYHYALDVVAGVIVAWIAFGLFARPFADSGLRPIRSRGAGLRRPVRPAPPAASDRLPSRP